MRIKRLEIQGFKSFADRTVIHFGDGITGVVGPNGCGKSNIVDALRWAMGEQSAKHLRGSGMDDVIFAGSESRGPMGLSEVTITFKNDDGSLVPPEYRHLSEISVTRRLFRDGTSEYLINKTKGRLRDVYDLFMGTGIGTKSYSIIEQGRIGLLVTQKPEDRRSLIEDAAGISKYKARRKTAERRLDATEQNLLRVSDIVGELKSRLTSLEKQAERAEKFKKLRAELKDLDLHTAVHRLLELTALEQLEAKSAGEGREQLASQERSLEEDEAQLRASQDELAEKEQGFRTSEHEAQQVEQRLAVGEKNVEHLERELAGLGERREEAIEERTLLISQLAEAQQERRDLEHAKDALATSSGEEAEALVMEKKTLETVESRIREKETVLEDDKRTLVECLTAIAQQKNNLTNLERSAGDFDVRIERLEAEGEEAREQCRASERASSEAKKKLDENRQLKLSLDDERHSQESLLERLSAEFMENEAQLLSVREELMDRRSRLSSLEEIQRNYEGCEAGVRAIMQRSEETDSVLFKLHGLVADVISADPKFETAVEAVLGERLQYVIVNSQRESVDSIQYLKTHADGRSTFVPLDLRADHVSWAPRKSSRPPEKNSSVRAEPHVFAEVELDGEVQVGPEGQIEVSSRPRPTEVPATEVPSAVRTISDKPPPLEVQMLADEAQRALHRRGKDAVASDLELGPLGGPVALPVPEALEEWEEEDVWPDLQADGVCGRLIDLVTTPPGYEDVVRVLIGDIVVVEDIDTAQRVWDEGVDHRKTIVTLSGEVLDPVGILSGGSNQGAATGMLAQKREIKELRVTVDRLSETFEIAEAKHTELSKRIQKIEEALQGLSDQRHEEELSIVKLEKDLRALEETAAIHRERETMIAREVEQIKAERAHVVEETAKSTTAIAELGAKQQELEERIDTRLRELEDKRTSAHSLSERVTELKVTVASNMERHESSERNLSRVIERIDEIEQRISRLSQNITVSETGGEGLKEQLGAAKVENEDFKDKAVSGRAALVELRAALDEETRALREHEDTLKVRRKAIETLKDSMTGSLMKLREHELAKESLREQVYERYQIVLDHVITDFHMHSRPSKKDKDQQKKLRRSIAAMGEINLTAIQEFEEVKERYDFLSTQKEDLEKAMARLHDAIKQINVKSRERFVETFELVNEKFHAVFPRLFKGGRASLVITDPSNPLESGIELLAQPPGKNLQNITLLSGGEKALTAVALIFSIFLIKPTPFCLLDEVDAPLDDANVGRYNEMVRDMSQLSQFILITHNKRTMEIPDRIYGVTMEEPGISKLVGVDITNPEAHLRVAS